MAKKEASEKASEDSASVYSYVRPTSRHSSKLRKDPSDRPQTAKSSLKSVPNGNTAFSSPPPSARLSVSHDRPSTARLPTPTIVVHDDSTPPLPSVSRPSALLSPSLSLSSSTFDRPRPSTANESSDTGTFLPLMTDIPTGSLDDLMSPDRLTFSNRGSLILLDANKWKLQGSTVMGVTPAASPEPEPASAPSIPKKSESSGKRPPSLTASSRSVRVLSADEASLSQRVRSMYEYGTEDPSFIDQTLMEEDEDAESSNPTSPLPESTGALSPNVDSNLLHLDRTTSRNSTRRESFIPKTAFETAGGIEDWEDIKGDEVDRFGFILHRKSDSRASNKSNGPDTPHLQRVSTVLLEASNTPRKTGMLRRMPSRASARSPRVDGTPSRQPSKRSLKPQGSIYSHRSNKSLVNSQTGLRTPMNSKERKLLVEAGDMLTLPPGLAESALEGAHATKAMQAKERQREGKWKKMGKLRPSAKDGGGMQFDFDPRDPKVIERTWKGIPDRWRATAWYSFLEASAKRRKSSPQEAVLIEEFYELQNENSADDVQIDCDVPRTISRHIMFRRRYRGGQRLLFRVLHALSLYFPDIGYVQGMAALAATLLCYYDEEHAFVMMVRLWQLRGLQRLYESGFEGLMDALTELEKEWLRDGQVAKKLEELGIHSTAYGTRWYLTLFNYSIPFPAQLRVWDVFMLLGDESNACKQPNGFGADLDVLHATAAALIDATSEILLDSDFENAMKVLTSWVPVKDEDLLMKVANAEWKARKRRGKSVS